MSANTAPDPAEQTQGQKKHRITRVLLWAALWATALVGLLWINLPPSSTSGPAAIEAAIVKSENAIRPTIPKKIDEITTLVAIRHAGSRVQYDIVVDLSKVASRPTASFIQQLRALNLPKLCNSEMVQSLGQSPTNTYIAMKNGYDLGSYIISNSDCPNPTR